MTMLHAAHEHLERGLSIIPIDPETKKPLIRWKEYQERLPTEEEVGTWWTNWPDAWIAVVTGAVSGYLVVDCDNEAALNFATRAGLTKTPVKVKTKRGWHFYFRDPGDGQWRGPRAGVNSTGADWPQVPGLDFRGDGSYALLPPSPNYEWRVDTGFDLDEAGEWRGWSPADPAPPEEGEFDFRSLDLSAVKVTLDDLLNEWTRTERYIKERGWDKIPTGMSNGRNERVFRYAAEQVAEGYFGPPLRLRCRQFMARFFVDPLPDREFEDTINSVEHMERRNHPDRFDETGAYIFKRPDVKIEEDEKRERPRRLVTASDADELIKAGQGREYLLSPWLRPASITQIHGYSGSGKSLFTDTAMYALATGAAAFGPFEITRPARVLKFDFEMGKGDVGLRLKTMATMFGDAGDGFQVWTPWIEDEEINLRKGAGMQTLADWIGWANPEVVVIDTIRTAWSGLQENDANEWSQVNELALRLRNHGLAVVMLHHSNKPGDGGLGREAGSTNQLTVLETQLRIAQVYRDKETAEQKAGVWDDPDKGHIFMNLEDKLPPDWFLSMVLEVSYGKVREWTDMHDQRQWVGWATHAVTGEQTVVASMSVKQRARELAAMGKTPADIAYRLGKPLAVINTWLGLIE